MTASQRIRHIIKTKNLTVEVFAEKVGTTRSTLNQMFKNDSNPKLPLLQSCLKVFPDLNPRWLLTGEGEIWEIEKGKQKINPNDQYYQALQERLKEMEDLMANVITKMEQQVEESYFDIKKRIEKLENRESH